MSNPFAPLSMAPTGCIMTLATLRAASDTAWQGFLTACREHGFADEWQAYRADLVAPWPAPLTAAHDAAMRDLHAFYLARDGAQGVLGSRGL